MPRLPSFLGLLAALVVAAPLAGCVDEADVDGPVAPGEPVSLGALEAAVAPYGEWIDTPRYGLVFRPAASPDFVPYASDGRWVRSDDGWEFESDDPWGPVTYHYGRWVDDAALGWVWVPDTTWGPAWVDWRMNDAYIGWVPLAPGGFVGVYGPWFFVRARDFVRPYVAAHVVR
ncbi:MAG TPA: DUF6600 domain-containing protein, partial [Minicystis sp.]|nr:DUF6600 domain-containing protein [Minicystis sp.]